MLSVIPNQMTELHRGLLPENVVKKGIRFVAKRVVPLSITTSLIIAACGGEKTTTNENQSLSNPENLPPFAALNMPFPKDPKMQIQQGWLYTESTTQDGRREHGGIDFIKGSIDNSRTWKSFSVTAAADGNACANPPSREGNAVLITHEIGDTPIGATYYGHLNKIEKDIPACNDKKKTPKIKKQGEKIGDAGSTGAVDQSWIHLHFQVNDANGNPVDPYDLQDERDIYPHPSFSDVNKKPCGPKALFKGCYPKGMVIAAPKNPIPPISTTITQKEIFTATPTQAPTRIPTETPKRIALPTPTPRPKPTETKKPVVEKKVSLSKKPVELYNALFTNSIPDGMFPPNVTRRTVGSGVTTFTAQGVKAIYQVDFIFLDKNIEIETTLDQPNAIISYIIFPNNIDVKSTYEVVPNPINSKKEIQDFHYPALVSAQSPFGGSVTASTMVFEDVLVATTLRGIGQVTQTQKEETINLAKAAVEFLKKVGQ